MGQKIKLKPIKERKNKSGQSLVEILIALGIGTLLIGVTTVSIVYMLRVTGINSKQEIGNRLNQDLMNKVQSVALARFNDLYLLEKGSSSRYYIYNSSSGLAVVKGIEGVANDAPQDGLIGAWGIDEAEGQYVHDASGRNNHGQLVGVVNRVSEGCQIGGCLEVPGEDHVQAYISDSPLLSSFTISGWARLEDGEDGTVFYIRANGHGSSIGVNSSGVPEARIKNSGNTRLTLNAPSSFDYHDDAWHHLALTFDGATRRGVFYLDSVPVASGTASNGITATTAYILIGNDLDSVWGNWDGELDDMRLWNRALSAEELSFIYESSSFTRYFYIEDACRSKNTGENTGIHSCDPLTEYPDPSTARVTNITEWRFLDDDAKFSLSYFITRWQNSVFNQNDWSDGFGNDGPVSVPGRGFSTSTNINFSSSGVIKIDGL